MYKNLIKWIENNGGYIHPQLYIDTKKIDNIIYSSVYCKNTRVVKKREQLVKIPNKLVVSQKMFYDIPSITRFAKVMNYNSDKFRLLIVLIHESIKKEKSFYYSYIKTLPSYESFHNHPIYLYYLNPSSFKILENLNVEFLKIIDSKSKELLKFIDITIDSNKEKQIFSHGLPTDELKKMIIWSYLIITTRSWGDKLIPFNDIFNHNYNSNIFLESKENNYFFYADAQFNKNHSESYEVFDNYGHYALMSLQSNYNFLPQNEINFLRLVFTLNSNDKFEKLKIKEIKGCKLNNKRILLSNEGPSKDTFTVMRILSLENNEYDLLSVDSDIHKYRAEVSTKNELKSIRLLIKIVLDLKKVKYSLDIMNNANTIISAFKTKKVLSSQENIIQNICLIKIMEYKIIEDNLIWANDRLLNTIKRL